MTCEALRLAFVSLMEYFRNCSLYALLILGNYFYFIFCLLQKIWGNEGAPKENFEDVGWTLWSWRRKYSCFSKRFDAWAVQQDWDRTTEIKNVCFSFLSLSLNSLHFTEKCWRIVLERKLDFPKWTYKLGQGYLFPLFLQFLFSYTTFSHAYALTCLFLFLHKFCYISSTWHFFPTFSYLFCISSNCMVLLGVDSASVVS